MSSQSLHALAYHGSLRRFDTFQSHPDQRMTRSPTARFGTFCIEDPRIAASFTLRPHVLNAGYRSPQGSRSLWEDPWALDEDPFDRGASVAEVEVRLIHPKTLSALTWVDIVEQARVSPEKAQHHLERWQAAGHDGLRIDAWNPDEFAPSGQPSLETDAITWVAFHPSALRIQHWFDAEDAWARA